MLTRLSADRFSRLLLFLVLALLVSTPLRVHALIALLCLYSVAYLVANPRARRVGACDMAVLGLLSLYALSQVPHFLLDDFSGRYLSPGLHMVALFPVYLMLKDALSEAPLCGYRRMLETGIAVGGSAAGVLAVYQTIIMGHYKADGFLFHINFGYLSASLFLLGVGLLSASQRRGLLLLGVAGALLATLLSISRGAIFSLPLVLGLVWLITAPRWGVQRSLIVMGCLVLVAGASYLFVPLVQERIAYTVQEFSSIAAGNIAGSESSGGRVQLWIAAVEAWRASPFIGLTYGERELLNAELVQAGMLTEWVNGISRGHAHSQYFEVLATGGLVGVLALFFYLLLPAIFYLVVYVRRRDNPWALAGLMFSMGFVLFCLTEVALQHEMIATYYAYMHITLFLLLRKSLLSRKASDAPRGGSGEMPVSERRCCQLPHARADKEAQLRYDARPSSVGPGALAQGLLPKPGVQVVGSRRMS
ncbi:O-antigen ligase family protein [uncultured Halomonas sp.]|uniref:O-antigen ligase family protein n=1 Tax=uncultured Halomonas sp. TaxID=173971 RepID=UPI0026106DA6|nr:O-antigen ligase family protein [uncultured Halomonas sp.]